MTVPVAPHTATVSPEGEGYLVTCPRGCHLGTSAHVPGESAAAARVHLHQAATTPLGLPEEGDPGHR